MGIIAWVFFEVVAYSFCYASGWVLIKVFTLGRLAVAPKRKSKRRIPGYVYDFVGGGGFYVSDRVTAVVGGVFWIGILLAYGILS